MFTHERSEISKKEEIGFPVVCRFLGTLEITGGSVGAALNNLLGEVLKNGLA